MSEGSGGSLWTSTEIVFSPGCGALVPSEAARHADSAVPDRAVEARVVEVIVPVGRLNRQTSVPFM